MSTTPFVIGCTTDSVQQREADPESVDKVNPAKFDKADDMAELTHLNEPSVVHNLHMRYQADLIYVSGAAMFNPRTNSAHKMVDILRTVLSNSQPILPSPHIFKRLYQHVQRTE